MRSTGRCFDETSRPSPPISSVASVFHPVQLLVWPLFELRRRRLRFAPRREPRDLELNTIVVLATQPPIQRITLESIAPRHIHVRQLEMKQDMARTRLVRVHLDGG